MLMELPKGYILASKAHYPSGKSPLTGKPLGYTHTAQLLNTQTADMPRGTGNSYEEAIKAAIQNCGGDDGLSAMFRNALKPEGHA